MNNKYEVVIGLEIHIELKTKTKIFCSCSTLFGSDPNTCTCPVCLGLPGALPVLNKEVVRLSVIAGVALNSEISNYCNFDRKSYYYPDLTKNFQTSQFGLPICKKGFLDINIEGKIKRINITRIHMEEDAGKLIHSNKSIYNSNYSKIDYNRAGIPLIEIVTEPDFRNSKEAKIFIEELRLILLYMNVSNCKMEEGSLRCDINISLKKKEDTVLGTRTEIKNLNSLRSLEKAINYEINRQSEILNSKKNIIQETRAWDEEKEITIPMRSKEEAQDYRYFPEPDLLPIVIEKFFIQDIKNKLPELPNSRRNRYINKDNLSEYDSNFLISDSTISDFYDKLKKIGHFPKTIVNYLMGDYNRVLKEFNLTFKSSKVSVEYFSELLKLIENKTISSNIAKDIIYKMIKENKSPISIIKDQKLVQISDEDLIKDLIEDVLKKNKQAVCDFNEGKKNAFKFLVGQVMKISRGRANPIKINKILKNKIEKNKI